MKCYNVTESYTQYNPQYLIVELAVKGQANSLGQQTGVLVARGVGDDSDVATGDHLGRVSTDSSQYILLLLL